MTVLDYYRKYLGTSVKEVRNLYFSPNLVPDDFPYYSESFNKVIYEDGTVNYFLHPFEFEHSLKPVEMKDEWLAVARDCQDEKEDVIEDIEI